MELWVKKYCARNISRASVTHIYETRRTKEEVVLFQLPRMNNRKVTTDTTIGEPAVRAFELVVLCFRQIGHRACEVDEVHARHERPSGEDAQLGFASPVVVTLRVCNLDVTSGDVKR
jgi:hypothetical protein